MIRAMSVIFRRELEEGHCLKVTAYSKLSTIKHVDVPNRVKESKNIHIQVQLFIQAVFDIGIPILGTLI